MLGGVTGGRKWVYMQWMEGWYRKTRKRLGMLQLAFLFIVPLLSWGGVPLMRLDLPARRVYMMGTVFTASDMFLVWMMALMAAFGLFFFTSLYGRLFCGYVCPQTVFLHDLVHPIERFFEGDRNQRMRRDSKDKDGDKWRLKVAKWASFMAVALLVSTAFMSWFSGPKIWVGGGGPTEYALVGIFGVFWFLDFAWFREQACNFLCPYARFQGVLCDEETWVIGYNEQRGEPRGKARKGDGGCIDCNKCVVVCPQGIDIRDGFQLECIQCGYCADACESVLGKFDQPSLVYYSTQKELETGDKPRRVRGRTIAYVVLLTVISGIFVTFLSQKQAFEVQLARAPGSLFQQDADGMVRNTFILSVSNIDSVERASFEVKIEGLDEAELIVPNIEVKPLEKQTVPMIIRLPAEASSSTLHFEVEISSGDNVVEKHATFKGPHK